MHNFNIYVRSVESGLRAVRQEVGIARGTFEGVRKRLEELATRHGFTRKIHDNTLLGVYFADPLTGNTLEAYPDGVNPDA